MTMRTYVIATAIVLLPTSVAFAGVAEVYKTPGCSCCEGWMDHASEHGLELLAHDVDMGEMAWIKVAAGIGSDRASCHTTIIGGYVFGGDVPFTDIARLLAERPDAFGLVAPGMPAGAPGMEGTGKDPYDVLVLLKDGRAAVFARH
jgi:hypothetical protein